MAAKQKILIDCDPGHDDAVAILYAHRHMDLIGVTTVHGNNSLDNTTRNALAVVEMGGIDAPVAMGCAGPLAQAPVGIAAMHGTSGLDGAKIPLPTRKIVDAHAVDFIIAMAEKHKGELILAAIGPETNIAMALRREPRLRHWVREITIMGGSTTLGNVTPAAEFNIFADVEAAWAVFESGIPIRMIGYNVTRQTGLDQSDIDRMRASGKKVAGLLADLIAFYLEKQRIGYGLTVAPMHDVCAIIAYVDPTLVDYVHTSVRIELIGTHTRGMTVCDLRALKNGDAINMRHATPANARVAVDARSRALIGQVVDTLLTYD
ncbi:MAG: ribosylpyrimidine nucleosidase [Alphaproteobacteria bacterium]|nr:MAG: ribosylpyrimidine nucleosidase [Alphaproteobacteria bacterium]